MSRWVLGLVAASSLLAACVDTNTPTGEDSDVLARSGASFHVVFGAPPGGDGSGAHPLGHIQEGVDMAEARGGGVVHVGPGTWLLTSPLEIHGSDIKIKGSGETLCVPDLEHPDVGVVPCGDEEDPDLHPNGQTVTGTETRIAPAPGYSAATWGDDPANANIRPLVQVGCGQFGRWEDTCPDGVLHGIQITGLTLDARRPDAASPNRPALFIVRTVDYEVEGNVIAGGSFGLTTSGSTGSIAGNYVGGVPDACGFCIHAPIGDDPDAHADEDGEDGPDVDIVGNTLQGNLVGVFLFGSSSFLRQQGDHLDADVRHNVFRRNSFVGVRIGPQIRPKGWPGFAQVSGNVTAGLIGNDYHANGAAYSFDHSFGYRVDINGPGAFDQQIGGVLGPCAPRWFTAELDISLVDETIGPDNGRSQITFTRPSPVNLVLWQYAHYATYTISDPGDVLHAFAGPGDPDYARRVRIEHPRFDRYMDLTPNASPFIDDCMDQREYDVEGAPQLHPGTPTAAPETDLDLELHNTLVINGVVMPHSQLAEAGFTCVDDVQENCVSTCDDLVDNDADGLFDAEDPDCADTCSDQFDNDGDFAIDGDDGDSCHATCGEALGCAIGCGAAANPIACLLGTCAAPICDATSVPVFDRFPADHPLAGLPTLDGGDATDSYYDVIGCAAVCGFNPACYNTACASQIGACQTLPCVE